MDESVDLVGIQAQVDREAGLRDLLSWCVEFQRKSSDWRKSSWEERWQNYQRDADSIYDPAMKAAKEAWQSKAFIPMVPSHRESLQANLYKTTIGSRPVLEMKARGDQADDQSENIRDLILREVEKSRFEVGFNQVLDDATTYGSGFCRIRFAEDHADRKVRIPVQQSPDPIAVAVMAQQGQLPPQPQIIGYQEQIQQVVTYRGVKFDWVNIWDVYPDPNALALKGAATFIAYPITYGDVVAGVAAGYFFPEAAVKLKQSTSKPSKSGGKNDVKDNRGIDKTDTPETDYSKKLECFEGWARLPKKWVYVRGEEIDDPEKLVPARVIFHRDCILTIEPNDQYDGESPLFKMDYMPVNGQFYARGIPEMLGGLQDVVCEGVNQRIDTLALSLNKAFALIEQFIINSTDIGSKPNAVIRVDAKAMRQSGIDDIRKVIMEIPLGNIDRSAYVDVQEMERYAQERTSVSKVTLGTAGGRDTNDTLGGMQLLRSITNEKIAYVGMLAEFMFLHDVFRQYWKVIYANIDPKDIINVLGEKRFQSFELLTPEQIENDYKYEPQGIFTQENKAAVQARLAAVHGQFAMFPWIKHEEFFDRELQSINEDPSGYRMTPEELQQMLTAQGMMQQGPAPMPGNPGQPQSPQMPGGPIG